MLPETAAPGAEIRPSVIVRVEELDGSQLPLLVTTVTFHRPSYGLPRKGGGRGSDGEKSGTNERADAVAAHELSSSIRGMARLIRGTM